MKINSNSITGCHLIQLKNPLDENIILLISDPAQSSAPLVLGVISGEEEASSPCVSHTENSLKKITLVNCLIIIILILVIAANINEGKWSKLWLSSISRYQHYRAQQDVPTSVQNILKYFIVEKEKTFLLICFLLTRCAGWLSDWCAGKWLEKYWA